MLWNYNIMSDDSHEIKMLKANFKREYNLQLIY